MDVWFDFKWYTISHRTNVKSYHRVWFILKTEILLLIKQIRLLPLFRDTYKIRYFSTIWIKSRQKVFTFFLSFFWFIFLPSWFEVRLYWANLDRHSRSQAVKVYTEYTIRILNKKKEKSRSRRIRHVDFFADEILNQAAISSKPQPAN